MDRKALFANLDREIARIFAPVAPRLVLLFGSCARGDADDASDVDVIVVYRTEKRFLDRLDELYSLWDLPVGVDILAYTPEEFEEMRVRSSLVADALEHGRIVVEAA